jgi:polyhydroxyalkanoate synthesis regulator phasin
MERKNNNQGEISEMETKRTVQELMKQTDGSLKR